MNTIVIVVICLIGLMVLIGLIVPCQEKKESKKETVK